MSKPNPNPNLSEVRESPALAPESGRALNPRTWLACGYDCIVGIFIVVLLLLLLCCMWS